MAEREMPRREAGGATPATGCGRKRSWSGRRFVQRAAAQMGTRRACPQGYTLRDVAKPIGVAGWETRLVESLPEELKGSLPTVEEIEAELGGAPR